MTDYPVFVTETKSKTKPLMVVRVADIRGPGAKKLYCHGYTALADLFGVPPIQVAEAVNSGVLDPLNLVELAIARQTDLVALVDEGSPCAAAMAKARELRRASLVEVCSCVPPEAPAPTGLETLWAYSYSDVSDAAGTKRSLTRVRTDMTSLRSIVDFVAARNPLIK